MTSTHSRFDSSQHPHRRGSHSTSRHGLRTFTILIIVAGTLGGLCLALIANLFAGGSVLNILFLTTGSSVIATALISIVLDLFWSRERAKAESEELEEIHKSFAAVATKLEKVEGRLEAFKQLGLNYCHATRSHALDRFYKYASDIIEDGSFRRADLADKGRDLDKINIVSSSARGLIGYLDRGASDVQLRWKGLIKNHPSHFQILLTHPAYAHLREPAEERGPGDIELEILKTAIYLHSIAGIKREGLRFYRGSPTVFTIQAQKHVLLNPYPYGKMAMETLCLEFETETETGASYVTEFVNRHFEHTWDYMNARSKEVDGCPLVSPVDSFADLTGALCECTLLSNPKRLRLTQKQVQELDDFIDYIGKESGPPRIEAPSAQPFSEAVQSRGLSYSSGPNSSIESLN